MIIKTDSKNKIIDAYQYTAEWREMPFQYDLYRSTVKELILSDKMKISKLRLERTQSNGEKDKLLEEEGIIELK